MLTPVLSLRLLCGVLCGTAAALTIITGSTSSAPLVPSVSRVANEFGIYLLAPALLCLLPGWRGSSVGRISAVLNVFAITLLVMPPVRAWETGQLLPERFAQVFGTEARVRHDYAEKPRETPFVLGQLLRPTAPGPVRHEQRAAQTSGGDVTLDIYRPSYTHEPIPGVIVVHGETWPGGVSRELVALDGYLAARDYVVVAIRDPLGAGRSITEAREEILSTIAYLKTHASELKLDSARLALMGRSVAGHLPLLVAYTADDPSIRGVIALYSPSDFARWFAGPQLGDETTRATIGQYLGHESEPSQEALDAASPIRHVRRGIPPTLLVHGMRDGVVPPDQSELLAARLEEADVRHVLVQLPWANHACDQYFAGPCGQLTTYAVERFLDGVMANEGVRARREESPSPEDL